MKMKTLLTSTFFLTLFAGTLMSQPGSSIGYRNYMKDYSSYFESFSKSGAALSEAATVHTQAIETLFGSKGIQLEADQRRATKRRENLYNWMMAWAPVYLSAFCDTDEDLQKSIDDWVADFGSEFGLPDEGQQVIRNNLLNYVKAYQQYQSDYNALQQALTGATPPPLPPPPPAPQQHHTNGR